MIPNLCFSACDVWSIAVIQHDERYRVQDKSSSFWYNTSLVAKFSARDILGGADVEYEYPNGRVRVQISFRASDWKPRKLGSTSRPKANQDCRLAHSWLVPSWLVQARSSDSRCGTCSSSSSWRSPRSSAFVAPAHDSGSQLQLVASASASS
jgi:hypothetical protein